MIVVDDSDDVVAPDDNAAELARWKADVSRVLAQADVKRAIRRRGTSVRRKEEIKERVLEMLEDAQGEDWCVELFLAQDDDVQVVLEALNELWSGY